MMSEALGLIEVIGYTPAVVAADAALKAANVRLAGITKVDGGIMTVQIFGDVGAIISAVEAGGMAASKVGTLRATHVIPSVDPALFGTVIKGKTITKILESESKSAKVTNTEEASKANKISKEENTIVNEISKAEENTIVNEISKKQDDPIVNETTTPEGAEGINDVEATISKPAKEAQQGQGEAPITIEELQKKSNMQLKMLIASLGIKVAAQKLKSAKKQDLIRIITDFYKE